MTWKISLSIRATRQEALIILIRRQILKYRANFWVCLWFSRAFGNGHPMPQTSLLFAINYVASSNTLTPGKNYRHCTHDFSKFVFVNVIMYNVSIISLCCCWASNCQELNLDLSNCIAPNPCLHERWSKTRTHVCFTSLTKLHVKYKIDIWHRTRHPAAFKSKENAKVL